VAKYTFDHNLAEPGGPFAVPDQPPCPASFNIETGNGVLTVGLIIGEDEKVQQVCVNMGRPILETGEIPVDLPGPEAVDQPIEILGQRYNMTAVSMGNPHAVFFCSSLEETPISELGPAVENHPLFPNRTNVNFVQSLGPEEFKMVTWERGSGLTLACGTGGCASAVAAVLTGHCQRNSIGHLPGGDLRFNWSQEDNCVYMTGPAAKVFHGEIDI
jgi:diaminopimelate epimerase